MSDILVQPVAWVEYAENGNVRMWSGDLSAWNNRPANPEPLYSRATVTALTDEIERLRQYETAAGMLAIEKAELRRLADAAEADAERYRWLRNEAPKHGTWETKDLPEDAFVSIYRGLTFDMPLLLRGEECDQAIDAVRNAK